MSSQFASDLLKQNELKKTPVRVKLLEMLLMEERPLSACDIIDKIEINCNESTVFRTLNTFVEKEMVSVAAMNDRTKIYSLVKEHHSHYVICRSCHQMTEINLCSVSPLLARAESLGFKDLRHHVEISGLCEVCS